MLSFSPRDVVKTMHVPHGLIEERKWQNGLTARKSTAAAAAALIDDVANVCQSGGARCTG